MKPIFYYLDKGYKKHPKKVLFVDEDKTFTYEKTYFLIQQLIESFIKSGVKANDKVILRTTRTIECALIILGLEMMGVTVALIDPYKRIDDIKIIEKENFSYDFYITNEKEPFSTAQREGWIILNKEDIIISKLEFKLKDKKNLIRFEDTSLKDGIILFTSGSTGLNKCVLLKQKSFMHHIIYAYDQTTFTSQDKIILLLPLNHVFGLDVLFGTLTKGASLYFPKTTEISYASEFINKYQINKVDSVPSLLYKLYEYVSENKISLKSINKSIVGGAPSSFKQLNLIENYLNTRITQVYGMSECFGISASTLEMDKDIRLSSSGKINKGASIKIVDENNKILKELEEGEICYKWDTLMEGYLIKNKLIKPFDEEGYLHTGDIGYLKEGYLYITGRKKDIIIRNGYKISCRAIENIIGTLPYIKEVAVVPLKDDERGEVPGALVTVNDPSINENIITKDLTPLIKRNETIGIGKIVKEMPLNQNGKIDKRKVKEILCSKL